MHKKGLIHPKPKWLLKSSPTSGLYLYPLLQNYFESGFLWKKLTDFSLHDSKKIEDMIGSSIIYIVLIFYIGSQTKDKYIEKPFLTIYVKLSITWTSYIWTMLMARKGEWASKNAWKRFMVKDYPICMYKKIF